jgi:endo-alpha-1,4-polygalactosaminidase (GH114 family)
MRLKEEILNNTLTDDTYLSEGLVFFKNSKRIRKYIQKMKDKNFDGRIDDVVKKFEESAKNFEKAERMHASGDRASAKSLYNSYKRDNADLIKTLNKDSVKKAVIAAGAGALVLNAVLKVTTGVSLFSRIGDFASAKASALSAAMPKMPAASTASAASAAADTKALPDVDFSGQEDALRLQSKELENQLKANQGKLNDIDTYQDYLKKLEREQGKAEKLMEKAKAAAIRAAERSESRIERAKAAAEKAAAKLN